MNDPCRCLPRADLLIWYSALLLASVASAWVLVPIDAVFGIGLAMLTLFLARADLLRFELPDFGNIALGSLGFAWIVASSVSITDDLIDAFARAGAAAVSLMAIRVIYRIIRKVEGLGLGDVKLAAAGAIWLPWSQVPIALLLAAVAGVVAATLSSKKDRVPATHVAIPFGAFLAPAIWLVWYAERAGIP